MNDNKQHSAGVLMALMAKFSEWAKRGVKLSANHSVHRAYTHTRKTHDYRKKRRKIAAASRARNRR